MTPSATTNWKTPVDVWRWLQASGEIPATFSSLVNLYGQDQDDYYQLSCVGVPADAPAWAKEIAELAAMIRHFIRFGFQTDERLKQIIGTNKSLYLGDTEFEDALQFLRRLSGTEHSIVGRDYPGTGVSSAEVRFNVGSADEDELDRSLTAARNTIKPRLLHIDQQDIEAIRHGMPAYVVNELHNCAPRVVQAPTVIFQGIRRRGRLTAGRAYCGKPRRAFGNDGKAVPAPRGMVYCVYVDPEGFVFDWDWVQEESTRPGYPQGYRIRFANQITDFSETVLILPSDVVPEPFKKAKAWHSFRGDCMFFYVSDAPAYAKRVNDELTEYRSIGSDELVGCKVKNFEELLSKVTQSAHSPSVPVSAVLAASLIRQMDNHQQTEKATFIRLVFEAAFRMNDERRKQFFAALVQLDDQAERYLQALCDMVLEFTQDRDHPVLVYAAQALASRQAIEDPYLRLITAAGKTTVSAQVASAV